MLKRIKKRMSNNQEEYEMIKPDLIIRYGSLFIIRYLKISFLCEQRTQPYLNCFTDNRVETRYYFIPIIATEQFQSSIIKTIRFFQNYIRKTDNLKFRGIDELLSEFEYIN